MIFGIIAEYNPFHNGHFNHIHKSKKITKTENCIVIMSGNFVQRGEPAVLNKQTRTKLALKNGASMVIELPVPFATGSADIFAYGAVNILENSNIIDFLCFGAETNNINHITYIADILTNEPKTFKEILKEELSRGISYPSARYNALSIYIKNYQMDINSIDLSFLKTPNNILALEYVKALKLHNSAIKPIVIQRKGNSFHQTEITSPISSATAVRTALKEFELSRIPETKELIKNKIKSSLPENIWETFFQEIINYPKLENYLPALDYILRTKTQKELSEILDMTEGLENRILKHAFEKNTEDLFQGLKTKRYTLTKIKHAITHLLLDIKKSDIAPYMDKGLPYIRILGFRKDKEFLLRELTEKSKIPVITNIKSAEKKLSPLAVSLLNKEKLASDIYYMLTTKEINTEYTKPIVIV